MAIPSLDLTTLTAESLVHLLPPSENSDWEWKSADLFKKGNEKTFDSKLARTVCAFANTGGGNYVIGLEDDKTIRPCPRKFGQASVKTWLQQKISTLISFQVQDVEVHELPIEDMPGEIIFVIQVPDSVNAPHQVIDDKLYLWRNADRTEKAPHFHIDNLFRRSTVAKIDVIVSVDRVDTVAMEWGTCFRTKFSVCLWNGTRVLAKPCACFLRLDEKSDWSFSERKTERMEVQEYLFPGSGVTRVVEFFQFVGRTDSPRSPRNDSPSRACARALRDLRFTVTSYSHNYRSMAIPFCVGEVVEKKFIIAAVSDVGETWWSGDTFRLELENVWRES